MKSKIMQQQIQTTDLTEGKTILRIASWHHREIDHKYTGQKDLRQVPDKYVATIVITEDCLMLQKLCIN